MTPLAEVLLVVGLAGIAALLLEGPAHRLRLPAPLLFLAAGIVLAELHTASRVAGDPATLDTAGTVMLVVILLAGGYDAGWRRIRPELPTVLALGVGGTLATTGLIAVAAYAVVGVDWPEALILGAILAPTDPAAVFSVLGERRRALGRVVRLLEGEAGFNDPVAISLATLLVAAMVRGDDPDPIAIAGRMAVEGAVAAGVGVGSALLLGRLLSSRFPTVPLAPTLALILTALSVFGGTMALHGSGFLAVYLFGLVAADRFTLAQSDTAATGDTLSELSSLAELGMFVMLGVALATVDLGDQAVSALLLAVIVAIVIRPLVAYPIARVGGHGRAAAAFVSAAGLKGAVPILLAAQPLAAGIAGGTGIFATVGIVVCGTLALQAAPIAWLAAAAAREPEGVSSRDRP